MSQYDDEFEVPYRGVYAGAMPMFAAPRPTWFERTSARLGYQLEYLTHLTLGIVRRVGVGLIHLTYPAEDAVVVDIRQLNQDDNLRYIRTGFGSLG